jgi:hypothetical protein
MAQFSELVQGFISADLYFTRSVNSDLAGDEVSVALLHMATAMRQLNFAIMGAFLQVLGESEDMKNKIDVLWRQVAQSR